jgi:hypothetical protein
VLVGLGRHGAPAAFDLAAAVAALVLGVLLLGVLHAGLLGAAVAVAVPLAISGGVLMPMYACRRLNLTLAEYARRVIPGPVVAALPMALCLGAARLACAGHPLAMLLLGAGGGGLITLAVYVRWVLPAAWRERLVARLKRRSVRASRTARDSGCGPVPQISGCKPVPQVAQVPDGTNH